MELRTSNTTYIPYTKYIKIWFVFFAFSLFVSRLPIIYAVCGIKSRELFYFLCLFAKIYPIIYAVIGIIFLCVTRTLYDHRTYLFLRENYAESCMQAMRPIYETLTEHKFYGKFEYRRFYYAIYKKEIPIDNMIRTIYRNYHYQELLRLFIVATALFYIFFIGNLCF